jgi:hypothetical protein
MGASHFTGPLISGPILQTSGTTVGQDVADVGTVIVAQKSAIVQSGTVTTAVSTDIVIPAYSTITAINLIVSTAFAGTFTVGTSATATELVATGATITSVGNIAFPPTTGANALLWENTGSSDVRIFIKPSSVGSGVGTLVVAYIQAINAP